MNLRLKEIIRAGNVIGDTRYCHYCRDLPALLVFTYADLPTRVQRYTDSEKYKNKSSKEVEQILLQRERDELVMGEKLYGEDYDYRDRKHYDIQLNMGVYHLKKL